MQTEEKPAHAKAACGLPVMMHGAQKEPSDVPTTAPPSLSSQLSKPCTSPVSANLSRDSIGSSLADSSCLQGASGPRLLQVDSFDKRVLTSLIGPGFSWMRRFVIFDASRAAPSRAGRHREGTSMLVMKLSSRSLKSGMPTDTSKGEPWQRSG